MSYPFIKKNQVAILILISFLFILMFSQCNKSSKVAPPFNEKESEWTKPSYTPLKKKPAYILAQPVVISLDTMPAPILSLPVKKKTVKEDYTNYSPLLEVPAYIPVKNRLPLSAYSSHPKEIRGKYVVALIPKPVKSLLPIIKENATRSIRYYQIDQGLTSKTILCMLKDTYGRLWIGTDNGLTMFDGTVFYHYSSREGISSNIITSLFEDKQGFLWIGTNGGGLNMFDGKGFTQYTPENGFPDGIVRAIIQDDKGDIFIATPGGLTVFNGELFTSYVMKEELKSNNVSCFLKDNQGRVWIGTYGAGINLYDGHKFIHYGVNEGLCGNFVRSMSKDSKGYIWIGTEKGLSMFNGQGFTNYTTRQGLLDNDIFSVLVDKKEDVWIGTRKDGISVLAKDGFVYYRQKEGLSINSIYSLLEDSHGQMWVGTDGGGLNVVTEMKFEQNPLAGESNIFGILEDHKNNIWLTTDRAGVFSYDGNKYTHYDFEDGNINNFAIAEDRKSRLWIGSGTWINIYDGNRSTWYGSEQGFKAEEVRCFYEDSKGNMWVGTQGYGVYVFDTKGCLVRFSNIPALNGTIHNILEDSKGHIWLSTLGKGVFVYDGKGFTNYTTSEGLSNNVVYSMIMDKKGRIWIGTDRGLNLYDGYGFIFYSTNEGLCDNQVLSFIKDTLDHVWVGTGQGLSRFTECKKDSFSIMNYKKQQGLYNIDFNTNASLKDKKGDLWWGIGTILTKFTPDDAKDSSSPISSLTQVDLMGRPVQWISPELIARNVSKKIDTVWLPGKDSGYVKTDLLKGKGWMQERDLYYDDVEGPYNLPKGLVLPYNQNWLTFHFTGIRFKDFTERRYRYILEGFDDKWGFATNNNDADYRNLPPGKYTFLVYARCRNSVWSCSTEFSFEILPPWWQTGWAYLIYTLAGIGMLMVYTRWRAAKWYKDKSRLEKMVDERTAEIVIKNKELEQLSIVASQTDNSIVILDADGKVEWINSSFERIYGTTLEELVKTKGSTIYDISNNPDIINILNECITKKKSVVYESLNLTKDKKQLWDSSTLTPIFDESGNLRKIIVIDADITERKLAEQIINQKNKDITDSIKYAKRIQNALLASKTFLDEQIPDSNYFVLYKPKDIVSGDFYWATAANNLLYVVTADCTGHGVPGAFMSLLNSSFLNEAIKTLSYIRPSDILGHVRKRLKEVLEETTNDENINDGMDCVLCAFDFNTRKLYAACANNPVFIVRNGEIIKIIPDKYPIGKHVKDKEPFTHRQIQLEKGDIVYTFTDGYVDQFGGENGKKFKRKYFEKLILSSYHLPMKEQQIIFNETMEIWKEGVEQVDDILVIGVKI
jgi:PAS domain S-box-containing protein